LSLVGTQRIQSNVTNGVTSNTSLYTIPTLSGCGAYFDYCVTDGSTNKRIGTVIVGWLGSNTTWTDTSTPDIGNTSSVSFIATSNGTDVNLQANVSSGTWTIRLSVRVIY
jgi:hypothetical protein